MLRFTFFQCHNCDCNCPEWCTLSVSEVWRTKRRVCLWRSHPALGSVLGLELELLLDAAVTGLHCSVLGLAGAATVRRRWLATPAACEAVVDGWQGRVTWPSCATRHQVAGEAGSGAIPRLTTAAGRAAVCGAWGGPVQGAQELEALLIANEVVGF